MFEKSVFWLAQILQKPDREINLMLKRNCLQDKKKKKKNEIDRKRTTIGQLIEKELKEQNHKTKATNQPVGPIIDSKANIKNLQSSITLD